ncbi:aldo/keto reductase [Opitutus sp. GAS368]|uniref:aldo/keto reductase n=1 Tax=Opitutus sp. GAS368 TaxID=1882749 RepID=UPI000B847BE8|nr:aldo/keto reductase [Opitutus sp. GAS368]
MQTRTLGRTGINVSVVGVGTWQFGGEWGRAYTAADAREILAAAQDCGINLIDTAECYGDHLSERLIGETLPGKRADWIIATKWGHKFHECFKREQCVGPADLLGQLDASLKALRTDYVDLLQFHSGSDAQFATPGMWEAAHEAKRQGKVRFLGNSISSNTADPHQVDRSTDVGVDVIQLIYNRLEREPETAVFPSCARQNLGVLAREPLASGFLSGKYKPGHKFPANDVREVLMQARQERLLGQVAQIAATEVPAGVPMAQWALAWVLKNPAVTAVIPGCKDAAQVRANAAAVALL